MMNSSDNWETRYHELYERFQQCEKILERDMQEKVRKLAHAEKVIMEKTKTILDNDEALRTMGCDLRCLYEKEERYVKERSKLLSKVSLLENDLVEAKEQHERAEREMTRVTEKLKSTVSCLRSTVSKQDEDLRKTMQEIRNLQEVNEGLRDTLRDLKDGMTCQEVKQVTNIDIILSKYLEMFPQDEDSIRLRFVDKTTQQSSLAFHMLLQLCHEDALSNVTMLKHVVPTRDSMVGAVVHHSLFVEMCRYARIQQCKNAGIFEEAIAASSKTKEMTRHKINYEEVELVSARQQFVMAMIKAMSQAPTKEKNSDDDDCDSFCSKSKCETLFDTDGAVGFD